MQLDVNWAAFLGGLVAAEGSFNRTSDRFRFAVALAETDTPLCEMAAELLDVGHVYHYPRRQPHYHDEVIFAVQSIPELVHTIVPFMDSHLPLSKKRDQYLKWRQELLAYWEKKAKRRRTCVLNGCSSARRAKGLCRHHYFQRYRR
ncbi:MAG: LAGLIDADG family homing endonuclease [Actinomycetota bacterium]